MKEIFNGHFEEITDLLKKGTHLSEDYRVSLLKYLKQTKNSLFFDIKKEYELIYADKEREEDILADTMAVPLQKVKTFRNGIIPSPLAGEGKGEGLRSDIIITRKKFESVVENIGHSELKQAIKALEPHFGSLTNPDTNQKSRSDAKKQLLFILHSQIEPFIGNGKIGRTPATDTVIPMAIVKGTRGYIEKIALQVNGCYESGWFDACAVMLRRIVETLIIECFEYHKIAKKIKDPNGNYFFLKDLIDVCLKDSTWTLGRNTRKALPSLKDIGNLSAHNRRYLATKSDIDKIRDGVRVAVKELVHLSKLKN